MEHFSELTEEKMIEIMKIQKKRRFRTLIGSVMFTFIYIMFIGKLYLDSLEIAAAQNVTLIYLLENRIEEIMFLLFMAFMATFIGIPIILVTIAMYYFSFSKKINQLNSEYGKKYREENIKYYQIENLMQFRVYNENELYNPNIKRSNIGQMVYVWINEFGIHFAWELAELSGYNFIDFSRIYNISLDNNQMTRTVDKRIVTNSILMNLFDLITYSPKTITTGGCYTVITMLDGMNYYFEPSFYEMLYWYLDNKNKNA